MIKAKLQMFKENKLQKIKKEIEKLININLLENQKGEIE